nr:cysteine--tRNA ligase [Desulfobacterales bacterium]
MTLYIYNTLTKKKEVFKPIAPGKVGIYVCGVTVYDSCHIGHARSVVVFDVITRYLRNLGYRVTYVRNFTDIDDKIIDRARECGLSTRELSRKYIQEFYEDMDALGVKRADYEPKATEHISEIISLIRRLEEKGLAYKSGSDVYFSVEMFPEYGKLSGRKLEDMLAGVRIEVDRNKRNPFDFVLWKGSKPGEPSWESPWGRGRPGWHIECSAMSCKYLGPQFDIHGGGEDLTFPHHENEIAQSEGAFEKRFVNYWIHNGFVTINQEKMSKSLGNSLTVKELLKRYHPEALRLFLLSNHYRSPIDFSEQNMADTESALDKVYKLLDRIESYIGNTGVDPKELPPDHYLAGVRKRFQEAMSDDFNTAKGIAVLFDTVRYLNRFMDGLTSTKSDQDVQTLVWGRTEILNIGDILGIMREEPATFFEKKRLIGLEKAGIEKATVERLIAERAQARKRKDWARADQIRDQLRALNILIEDRPEGTVWKVG